MRPIQRAVVAAVAVSLLLGGRAIQAGQEGAAAPPAGEVAAEALEELEDQPGDTVPMVEVPVGKSTVRGRLLSETDEMIKIESLGRGIIGYRKEGMAEIKRFDVTAADYYTRLGDFHHERAWRVEDGAEEFLKSRQAYLRALSAGPAAAEEQSIRAKLELLSDDRDEWQKEALRKAELEKAQHEVELMKIRQEVAREQLKTAVEQQAQIQALGNAMHELQDQMARLVAFVDKLSIDVEDLEDEVDDLDRRRRVYITNTVFMDLKRAHDSLEREVRRLERSSGRN